MSPRYFLFALLLTSSFAFFDNWRLRSPHLNWAIERKVIGLYLDHVRKQDDFATKYGNFGDDGIYTGPNATLDPVKYNELLTGLIGFFSDIMTENATYVEYGFNDVDVIDFGTGPTEIGTTLAQIVLGVKLYGQYHSLGHAYVEEISNGYYRVGGTADTWGHIFPVPGSEGAEELSETAHYLYAAERYHFYKREINGPNVEFKLDAIQGYGFARFFPRDPAAELTNTSLGSRYQNP